MPQVIETQKGGVIRWDSNDWLSGLTPNYGNSTYGINSIVPGMAWTVALDPYRYAGFAAPGVNPTDPSNVSEVDGVLKNGVTNGNKAYMVGGAKMHEMTLNTVPGSNSITNTGSFPHTITAHGGHSSVAVSDIAIYEISGTKYAFYSWNDNTDGDVGRYDLSTTFDDDYMSTVPTSGAVLQTTNPHPMFVLADILYIGDGKDLASFDGTTFNPSALDLPNGYIITSITANDIYLVITAYKQSLNSGTYYKSEAKAFYWDTFSRSFTYEVQLNGNYVNGAFNYNGRIGCFITGGDTFFTFNRESKLMLENGNDFEPVANFSGDAPGHGGVEVSNSSITWNSDGTVYQYGSPHIGFGNVLNKIGRVDGTTSEGMLKNFLGRNLYASAGTSTSGGLIILGEDNDSACTLRVPQTHPGFKLYSKGRIQKIRFYWGFNASGGHAAKFNLLYDRNQSASILNGTTVKPSKLVEEYEFDASGNQLPSFSQVGWELTYEGGTASSTPDMLSAVEIHYKYENI